MGRFEASTDVAASPDCVFELATDIPNCVQNIEQITKVEILTDGPVGLGTRWSETRLMGKREATCELEISAWEPPRMYAVRSVAGGIQWDTDVVMEATGAGTRFSMSMDTKPVSFGGRLSLPLFKLFMRKMMTGCLQSDLDQIKALAER